MKKTKLKKGYEEWPEETKKNMQHTILEAEVAKLKKDEEVLKFEIGIQGIEEEVETSIAGAELALKAATIKLEALRLDKVNKYTAKRIKFELEEAKRESKRHENNVKALKLQLEQGKPPEVKPMPEEPTVEKTPEEIEAEKKKEEEKTKAPDDDKKEETTEDKAEETEEKNPAA